MLQPLRGVLSGEPDLCVFVSKQGKSSLVALGFHPPGCGAGSLSIGITVFDQWRPLSLSPCANPRAWAPLGPTCQSSSELRAFGSPPTVAHLWEAERGSDLSAVSH